MPWIIFLREGINNAGWFALKSFHSVYGFEKRNSHQSLNPGLVDFDWQPQIRIGNDFQWAIEMHKLPVRSDYIQMPP
jgi:hypothetical protein